MTCVMLLLTDFWLSAFLTTFPYSPLSQMLLPLFTLTPLDLPSDSCTGFLISNAIKN